MCGQRWGWVVESERDWSRRGAVGTGQTEGETGCGGSRAETEALAATTADCVSFLTCPKVVRE